MLVTGAISESAYREAVDEPIAHRVPPRRAVKAPYFMDYIKNDLENRLGSSMLYRGGLTIYSTLSPDLQAAAETAVQNGLFALEKRMQIRGQLDVRPQAALVALDVHTGEIRAMVGGRDFQESAYNRAATSKRQPGSAFKPIVYAAAVERLGFAQNMTLLDAPVVFRNTGSHMDWRPENFSGTYQGEMTLRKALALSKNIPTARLMQTIGPANVVSFAHAMGITSPLKPYLSLALGTSEVTLLELTTAYSVFPNKGQAVMPFGVMEVADRGGHVIWRVTPRKRVVMGRQNAAIVTDMLRGVVLEGTGKSARALGRQIAGKTGTTDDYRDALFIGFSPDIAAGVWVGLDTSQPLGHHETGARAALPIWMEFMQKALSGRPHAYFDIPDGVVRRGMDPITGEFLPDEAPGSVQALFKTRF
jgi:penicillin-binding protein 1A